jgi:sialic acid synthase SpsE
MTFIIAEAGVNHNGEMYLAKRLIDSAKECGADAVKFQLFSSEKLNRPELKKLELSTSQIHDLMEYCEGIEFMCTPFDVQSLEVLINLGIKRIKIGSGSVHNADLMKAAIDSGLPLIISTGMLALEELSDLQALENVTLLHCTSAYPCPLSDANLNVLDFMWEPFGYSDHTTGILVSMAAVAKGASVIEKHLTLDKHSEGPDHKASIEPHEFKAMVHGIRQIELALGDGKKRPMPSEAPAMKIWR